VTRHHRHGPGPSPICAARRSPWPTTPRPEP
jgi:hypothetical protein